MSSKLEFIQRIFGQGYYSHNTHEFGTRCPHCFHYKNKLFINIEKEKWHCFVCGKAGKNLYGLIKKVGSSADVKTYLDIYKPKLTRISSVDSAEEKKFSVELPKNFKPLIHSMETFYGRRAMTYLKNKRGLTEDDVLFYKIGISSESFYEDRVIFPSFDAEGVLNYYTTRTISDDHPMKHWSPGTRDDYKPTQIFNELYVNWKKPVVLVEGFVDAIKAENALPLLGSSLDEKYKAFQQIVRSGLPVYLAFDADAEKKTNRVAELFLSYDVSVFVIDPAPFGDVGEMTKEQFLEHQATATPYSMELIFRNKLKRMFK